MGQAYLAFARDEPGLYMTMFGQAQAMPEGPANPGTAAMDSLIGAAAVVLQSAGGSVRGARRLAMEIWALSHGVAMLMLGGHLATGDADCDPAALLNRASSALVEAAVRRPA
jgi:hypothetical protein